MKKIIVILLIQEFFDFFFDQSPLFLVKNKESELSWHEKDPFDSVERHGRMQ